MSFWNTNILLKKQQELELALARIFLRHQAVKLCFSLEEVVKYINSPPTFTASNFGLSETDYNTWYKKTEIRKLDDLQATKKTYL